MFIMIQITIESQAIAYNFLKGIYLQKYVQQEHTT